VPQQLRTSLVRISTIIGVGLLVVARAAAMNGALPRSIDAGARRKGYTASDST
jgi:hypothetical protein